MLVEVLARHLLVLLQQRVDLMQPGENDFAHWQVHGVGKILS